MKGAILDLSLELGGQLGNRPKISGFEFRYRTGNPGLIKMLTDAASHPVPGI